jgi:hypothetical protein
MSSDRIDFISAYCDWWCERCAFTERCSAYACHAAIGMCGGDVRQGIELAVGRPQPVEGEKRIPDWVAELESAELTAEEMAAFHREEEARRSRVEGTVLYRASSEFGTAVWIWLRDRAEALSQRGDALLAEALEVIAHDGILIHVKLCRALDGRDRLTTGGEEFDLDPVQNDWNGSAKVALISIRRSASAWRLIADASGDLASRALADDLDALETLATTEFPRAMDFVRPGFDE